MEPTTPRARRGEAPPDGRARIPTPRSSALRRRRRPGGRRWYRSGVVFDRHDPRSSTPADAHGPGGGEGFYRGVDKTLKSVGALSGVGQVSDREVAFELGGGEIGGHGGSFCEAGGRGNTPSARTAADSRQLAPGARPQRPMTGRGTLKSASDNSQHGQDASESGRPPHLN
jgi:hypothetical protein